MTRQRGSLEYLYRRYKLPLTSYLTQIVGSSEIAEELAKDSLEKMQQMYRPEQVTFPRATLFRVATTSALARLRRLHEGAVLVGSEPSVAEIPIHLSPAAASDIVRNVAVTITKLRPAIRKVFVMAYVQGKPRKEIAGTLGISEKQVDKRMTKALTICRAGLALRGVHLSALFSIVLIAIDLPAKFAL